VVSRRGAGQHPLNQFICDTCGEIIQSPEYGWVEWLHGDREAGSAHSFRICHVGSRSSTGKPCHIFSKHVDRADLHLNHVMEHLPNWLLAFLGAGMLHEPTRPVQVREMGEFLDFARRLTVPYYEEARKFWGAAVADGTLDGYHNISAHQAETLQRIINDYGPYGGRAQGLSPKIEPLSLEISVFAEKLQTIIVTFDWTSYKRPPESLTHELTALGEEIYAELGDGGMARVLKAAQRHMPDNAISHVDHAWSGIGNWMA